jgi:hypothetical protein
MKTILVSIGLSLAATAVHSMPVSILSANELSPIIAIADQGGDRYRGHRHASRASYSGRYVLVRDPLIQRRPFCPFGSYAACVMSGTYCTDLCY